VSPCGLRGRSQQLSFRVTAAELSAHAATILAKFKVPEEGNIFLVDEELPKGATGKIDKKGLRAKYSQKS